MIMACRIIQKYVGELQAGDGTEAFFDQQARVMLGLFELVGQSGSLSI